jgi:uncharacterized protein YlxW (UPF0749 family)
MEDRDIQLVRKLIPQDKELKQLWEEHLDYEEKLDKFNKKHFLTTEDELKRREIQKLKLSGRDKIEEILKKYRSTQG